MNETDAFVGEIRLFPIDWAPDGWLPCDGRSLPVGPNSILFSLIGTEFGGDGVNTFNLPDLRGRVPVSQGVNPLASPPVSYKVGSYGGLESVALTAAQVPPHTHDVRAVAAPATTAAVVSGGNDLLAEPEASRNLYAQTGAFAALAADSVSRAGGGAAHDNMQPSLVLNFCICTVGVYPRRP